MMHDRSQGEAFTRNVVLSREESMQFSNRLRMVKSSVQGAKSVSVYQDPGYCPRSRGLSTDENLPLLSSLFIDYHLIISS
ncbi:hypothetical protein LOAG_07148 [Loa loa]|uniref:Uncharacterized protein n=1 Tax=Loa loa TaxID=7209 RepID=A0A1S0TWF2_LOALO|nr:hypothetical protein LOAG_07148 [Loa loa]EFO21342.1 hypothetical protein LOAG_07148 [Loa loa]